MIPVYQPLAKYLFSISCVLILSTGFAQQKARRHATLGIYTHHETFSCACGENWQSNWIPSKLTFSLPFTDRFSIYPAVAVGKASNYHEIPQMFWSVDANAKFDFIKKDFWVKPYIFGGVGAAHFSDLDHVSNDGEAVGASSGVYGSANVGLGANFWFSEKFGIGAQHSLNVLPSYNNYYQASIGLVSNLDAVFDLASKRDQDKDGVPDINDKCPKDKGTTATHGCPDGDADGVADTADKCPEVAGSKLTNGCPDGDADGVADSDDKCPGVSGKIELRGCPDKDNDGVDDSDDACPDAAGLPTLKGCPDTDGDGTGDNEDGCPTLAGPTALKGCPDADADGVPDPQDECPTLAGIIALKGCPDKDGDGVSDKNDVCPDVKGVEANKGCPEIKPEEVKKIQKKLNLAATHIQFESGKSTLKPSSFADLNKIWAIMTEQEFTAFNINGHTDDVGNQNTNKELSQRRADAVREYILAKGKITSDRLIATGYGSEKPLADNKTAAGRTRNRRVEIILIDKPTN